MSKSDFVDYSSLLMEMERVVRSLHDKCLHKQYEGYMADIADLHSKAKIGRAHV